MEDTQSSYRSSLWLPFVAGMVGAGVALLFAPNSGKETRQHLKMAATGAKGRATEGLDTARASVEELQKQAKEAKQRVSEVIKTRRSKTAGTDELTDLENNAQDTGRQDRGSWGEEV